MLLIYTKKNTIGMIAVTNKPSCYAVSMQSQTATAIKTAAKNNGYKEYTLSYNENGEAVYTNGEETKTKAEMKRFKKIELDL